MNAFSKTLDEILDQLSGERWDWLYDQSQNLIGIDCYNHKGEIESRAEFCYRDEILDSVHISGLSWQEIGEMEIDTKVMSEYTFHFDDNLLTKIASSRTYLYPHKPSDQRHTTRMFIYRGPKLVEIIENGKRITEYFYNSEGRLIQVDSGIESLVFEYNEERLSKVSQLLQGYKNSERHIEYDHTDRPYRIFRTTGDTCQLTDLFYYDPVPSHLMIDSKVSHHWCTPEGAIILKTQIDPEGAEINYYGMSFTIPIVTDPLETELVLTPKNSDIHQHFFRELSEVIIDQKMHIGSTGCISKISISPGTYRLRSPRIHARVNETKFQYTTDKSAVEEVMTTDLL